MSSKSKKFAAMSDDALEQSTPDFADADFADILDDLNAELSELDNDKSEDEMIPTVEKTIKGIETRKKASKKVEQIEAALKADDASSNQSELTQQLETLKEKLAQLDKANQILLPVSNTSVSTEFAFVDPDLCDVHPLNTRVLSDHNRVTLASRMASFERQGQQEAALVTPTDNGRYLVVDGAGRLKTWSLLREDNPEKYQGDVFYVRIADIPDADVPALSKTRNESEAMSDWNLAVMYQNMLGNQIYSDLQSLCKGEGLVYKTWAVKIKLADIPKEYISMFVKSAHIPSRFAAKVAGWEKTLSGNAKAKKGLLKLLSNLSNQTQLFLNGKGVAPYPADTGNVNPIIKQIQEYVSQFKTTKAVPKEKPIALSGKNISGTAKKDRNGKFVIKLDKCDDQTFQKIIDSINNL